MPDQNELLDQLRSEAEALRRENEELARLKLQHQDALSELRDKEAFNFALFQYCPIATVIVDKKGKVIKSNTAKRREGDRLPNIGDIMYRDYAAKHSRDMYAELMACMQSASVRQFSRMQYGNKILTIVIAPFPMGAIITCQDVTKQVRAEQDRLNLIEDLRRTLDEVETLRGLLPICASCKNVRDDKGYWNTVEEYFSRRSKVDFSHTVCPDCMQKLYPEMWEAMNRKRADKPA